MSHHIGVLAYGSLITDPGDELANAEVRRIGRVTTPFTVEFARASRSRAGAPTLVPVENGSQVLGEIIVLAQNTSLEQARSMVWRRETRQTGSDKHYEHPENPGPNTVVVRSVDGLEGIEHTLYTEVAANIDPLTPANLAAKALRSAEPDEAAEGLDGITYLADAIDCGILTRLTASYRESLLDLTGSTTLRAAQRRVRHRLVGATFVSEVSRPGEQLLESTGVRLQRLLTPGLIQDSGSGLVLTTGDGVPWIRKYQVLLPQDLSWLLNEFSLIEVVSNPDGWLVVDGLHLIGTINQQLPEWHISTDDGTPGEAFYELRKSLGSWPGGIGALRARLR